MTDKSEPDLSTSPIRVRMLLDPHTSTHGTTNFSHKDEEKANNSDTTRKDVVAYECAEEEKGRKPSKEKFKPSMSKVKKWFRNRDLPYTPALEQVLLQNGIRNVEMMKLASLEEWKSWLVDTPEETNDNEGLPYGPVSFRAFEIAMKKHQSREFQPQTPETELFGAKVWCRYILGALLAYILVFLWVGSSAYFMYHSNKHWCDPESAFSGGDSEAKLAPQQQDNSQSQSCIECTNNPSTTMLGYDTLLPYTCERAHPDMLSEHCVSEDWKVDQTCQESCYKLGLGAAGVTCCDSERTSSTSDAGARHLQYEEEDARPNTPSVSSKRVPRPRSTSSTENSTSSGEEEFDHCEDLYNNHVLAGLHSVTFGLVSAVVVAQLSTDPGNAGLYAKFAPILADRMERDQFWWRDRIYMTFILFSTRIYVLAWIGTGFTCLLFSALYGESVAGPLYETGTTWLGIATTMTFGFFGVKQDQPYETAGGHAVTVVRRDSGSRETRMAQEIGELSSLDSFHSGRA